ncbi:MAG: cache domain-containing protein, partial [Cyanobacteria bacterium J06621_11]
MYETEKDRRENNNNSQWLSITNQLRWGPAVLSAISLLGTASILIAGTRQIQLKQYSQLQKERAQSIAAEIEIYAQDLQRSLSYLANVRGLSELPIETQQSLLKGLLRHNDDYEALMLLDAKGDVVASQSTEGDIPTGNFSRDLFFSKPFTAHSPFVGSVVPQQGTAALGFTMAVPTYNQAEQVDGVLLAKLKLTFLTAAISQAQVGQTGYAYVIDHRRVLAASKIEPSGDRNGVTPLIDQTFIQVLRTAGSTALLRYQGLYGQKVLGAVAPIRSANWHVVVELPLSEAYAPIYRLVLETTAALLTVVLLAATVGLIMSRRIILPLKQLMHVATQMSEGQFDARAEVQFNNELGILIEAFNYMAAQVR